MKNNTAFRLLADRAVTNSSSSYNNRNKTNQKATNRKNNVTSVTQITHIYITYCHASDVKDIKQHNSYCVFEPQRLVFELHARVTDNKNISVITYSAYHRIRRAI